ncbi:MAG: RNA polymerase sigma factor [Sedimentisphaerales bacterium]|nr:RNA polymerase sigma factor [Sedimentisphaerales bacterium]
METKALHVTLLWDVAAVDSIESSQRWILSAMGRHGPALVAMLWRILGNEQDVCDAYQDTFLQLAHYHFGQKPDNSKAYLFRTASNVAITLLRKKKTQQKACQVIAQQSRDNERIDSAYDLDARNMQEELRENIARLPDYLRSIVILKDLAELPYRDVAKILGMSSASARVLRHRAIKILAGWMARSKR